MITVSLDSNRDIFIDQSGNLAISRAIDAVQQNCLTAMRAQIDEMVLNMNNGMPTRATAFDTYNPVQFEAAARVVLENVEGVNEVIAFSVNRVADAVNYTATISTIYGEIELNG